MDKCYRRHDPSSGGTSKRFSVWRIKFYFVYRRTFLIALTMFHNIDHVWPNLTSLTIFDNIDQIWSYWPKLTTLTTFDNIDQIWPDWPYLTSFTKFYHTDHFFNIWPISTFAIFYHIDHIRPHWKLNILGNKTLSRIGRIINSIISNVQNNCAIRNYVIEFRLSLWQKLLSNLRKNWGVLIINSISFVKCVKYDVLYMRFYGL